jgi:two-component sensor histidine kinase
MKRVIGLTIILLATAGCAFPSKTAQASKNVEAQALAIQSLENRINLLENSHVKLLVRSNTQRWELDTRIKALEEILKPGSISSAMKNSQPPKDLSLEGRIAKLETQVARLQSAAQKKQGLRVIPVNTDPNDDDGVK